MKTTLFARWRRKSTKIKPTGKSALARRTLRVESLEGRALLTASAASTYSPYDVNHDGYLNMADVISEISYYNAHGPGAVTATASATSTGHSALLSVSSAAVATSGLSSTTSSSSPNPDVTGDGYVNLSDVIHELNAFDSISTLASYTLVPTNAADQPLGSTPIVVGQTFYLDVVVQDTRTDAGGQPLSYAGVAGGDVDVTYTPDSSNPGRRGSGRAAFDPIQFDQLSQPHDPLGARRRDQHAGRDEEHQRQRTEPWPEFLVHSVGRQCPAAESHSDDGHVGRCRGFRFRGSLIRCWNKPFWLPAPDNKTSPMP